MNGFAIIDDLDRPAIEDPYIRDLKDLAVVLVGLVITLTPPVLVLLHFG